MLTVINNTDIEYTHGDSFNLNVSSDIGIPGGAILRMQINTDEETNIINTTFSQGENGFDIELTADQRSLLPVGNYIYRLSVVDGADIVTEKSGNLKVKWGA